MVYPNCPFDYCKPINLQIPFKLNQPSGIDERCAFDRSAVLCGSCQSDLSLSLGSSLCISCPRLWPLQLIAIIITAIVAGVLLVLVLLFLNITVAVGTLNGLIFYANIIHANRNILFGSVEEWNFLFTLVSWLNLDFGIDTCFFPGLNVYTKTWLQLLFPAYVIFLVVLVIIISSFSLRFSKVIGKKDPVATLATLILFSYANHLHTCFWSLSAGILEYPDGSRELVWLPDSTVRYLSGKHIPLFITAIFIVLIGLIYTVLLLSWQWLLQLPNWRVFKWSRNQRLQIFIETHHIPYTPKHRYWPGLLLLVHFALYLVASLNVSNDPGIALMAIILQYVVF